MQIARPKPQNANWLTRAVISDMLGGVQRVNSKKVTMSDGRLRRTVAKKQRPASNRDKATEATNTESNSQHAPAFVPPMLAKLVRTVPEGLGWALEVKFDGYRIEAIKNGTNVRLYSRRGNDFTKRFGSVLIWFLTNDQAWIVSSQI